MTINAMPRNKTQKIVLRFEVLRMMKMSTVVFEKFTPCNLVSSYHRFEISYFPNFNPPDEDYILFRTADNHPQDYTQKATIDENFIILNLFIDYILTPCCICVCQNVKIESHSTTSMHFGVELIKLL